MSFNYSEIEFFSQSELRRPITLPVWIHKTEENSPPQAIQPGHAHTITVLPDELLQVIFNNFESKQLWIASQACKRFARISSSKEFERIISHYSSYNLGNTTAMLDGVNVPSNYIEPEGDDNDSYW